MLWIMAKWYLSLMLTCRFSWCYPLPLFVVPLAVLRRIIDVVMIGPVAATATDKWQSEDKSHMIAGICKKDGKMEYKLCFA